MEPAFKSLLKFVDINSESDSRTQREAARSGMTDGAELEEGDSI